MLVRRAEIKDIEKINELLLQVAMVHHYGRPDLFKANCRKYKNDELVEIIKDDNRPIFVAEDDGVGILDAQNFLLAACAVVAGLRLKYADLDDLGAAGCAACEQAHDHDGRQKQSDDLFHRIFPPSVHVW